MGSDVQSLSFILFSEGVRQERMCVLSNWGKAIQKSGKGQDNYRANIVEWLLSHLAAHASEQGASAAFFFAPDCLGSDERVGGGAQPRLGPH